MDIDGSRFYIDGKWRRPDGGSRIAVVDPCSENVIGHVTCGTGADAERAVSAARRAFTKFSNSSVDDRLALLGRIHVLLAERAESFAQALVSEMGAPVGFARASQVPLAIEHVRVQTDVLRRYSFLKIEDGMAIAREAIGVCALITPWNWPLYQITAKVAPAIAAGCTMILKPSELTPFSALLFAQVMHDAEVPPGVFNLVVGTGETVGATLAQHDDVDLISITGSTRAGVAVAQAAASSVKRVVQELGGKSPNVFLDDADFSIGVPKGVQSAMRNAGQSCSAPTRMLVPKERLAEVEELAAAEAARFVVGDPSDPMTTMGPIANAAQFRRVQAMIEAGIAEGGRLICGGPGRPKGLERGYFTRPTIFSDVMPQMRLGREEIFGPVLVIMPYENEEHAIELANSTEYGLGAHVQSCDPERARRAARQIRSGQVHINYPKWSGFAPFGGYKRSGNGREYGVFGLEEYLETKAILGY
ncbi:MAG: aldehyde dehydrogenase family protein [Gammaproteobacteria bacterium]|nr:aldehyde dehydrogenase family protein [Gammaproteobacteria bacterium]